MKKIGVVSCDKWKNMIKEDLFLQKELVLDGFITEIISWQDKSINYNDYECLILRSVWGYQNYYSEFKNWLFYLRSIGMPIYNNVNVVMDNIRKDIQFSILDKHSINYVPTIFIKSLDELKKVFPFDGINVVKPIISGSGNNTYTINQCDVVNELESKYHLINSHEDNGLMIQPYFSGIEKGEFSCIFIDGINTHNMLRFPGIFGPKKKPIYLPTIPQNVKELATLVSEIPEYKNYLYMRVDIVTENNSAFVMEVELAEPDLLIKYIDELDVQTNVLRTFTKKIERRL